MNGTFNKFIWKCKIDISEFTEGENHFITLREPTLQEYKALGKVEEAMARMEDGTDITASFDAMAQFAELCNTLIIDHDFLDGDKKCASKEVAEFIAAKMDLAQAVMAEFFSKLPLLQKSGKK